MAIIILHNFMVLLGLVAQRMELRREMSRGWRALCAGMSDETQTPEN
jgi:hypothetical protein